MWLPSRHSVALLLALAGCDRVFDLSHLPTPETTDGALDGQLVDLMPVQSTSGTSDASGMNQSVSFNVIPTTLGNTLVLTVHIATSTRMLILVSDTASNTWMRALAGVITGGGQPVRVEIWYAQHAQPTDMVTLTFQSPADQRPVIATLTEWPPLSDKPGVAAVHAEPFAGTNSVDATSGEVSTTGPALMIAALAYTGTASVTLGPSPLHPLPSTAAAQTQLRGASAYLAAGAGTYGARWTLSMAENWSAGIVAFPYDL